MAGLIYIDTNGNATFNSDVTIKGTLYANTVSPVPGNDLTVALGNNKNSTNSSDLNSKFQILNSSGAAALTLNQSGDLTASGTGTFGKLNLSLVQPALAVSGTEVIATGSAGTASIEAHQTQLTIDNPLVTDKSLIYITPTSDTGNQVIFLQNQVPGKSFTVGIQNPSDKQIPFNWIIVN